MSDGKDLNTFTLLECLESSSWRRLLAIMETCNLSASTRQKKDALIERLFEHLQQPQTLPESIAHFSVEDQRALLALIEANGALPTQPFTERFGSLRVHRPWEKTDRASNSKKAQKTQSTAQDEKPWLNPISSTERLLYHGLIYQVRFDTATDKTLHFVIPSELLEQLKIHFATHHTTEEHLTPLPRPSTSGTLLHHVGIWLASLLQQPVSIRHNYWLPPNLLTKLIQRLGLDAKLPCRSERHVPYLAFLHILAESSKLIEHDQTVHATPAAWQWMAKPSAERLVELWNTLMPTEPDALAFTSRVQLPWESNQPKARQLIRTQLQKGTVGKSVPLDEWLEQLRLQDRWQLLPGIQVGNWEDVDEEGNPWATIDPVEEFCIGPLFWLGVIDLFNSEETSKLHMALTPVGAWLLQMPNSQPPATAAGAHIRVAPKIQNTLIAPLDVRPDHLCRVIPYCDWSDDADRATMNLRSPNQQAVNAERIGQHQLHLSPERIAMAAAAGLSVTEIMQDLAVALGQPVSRRMGQRVRAWAKEGQRIRIQTVTIVETESAELMVEMRRKKLTRRRLGPPISPNRAIIDPEQVAGLITSLATMDIIAANPFERYPVGAHPRDLPTDTPTTDLPLTQWPQSGNTDLPKQTQWMLLQLYRSLGLHVDLAVKIPWEVEKSLEAQLTSQERMSAAEAARVVADQLQSSLDGYLRIPSWKMPILMEGEDVRHAVSLSIDDKDDLDESLPRQSKRTIKKLLQDAIKTSQPVRIRYWSASHDHPLERTITPYYIEERHHIDYMTGYCHLREDERVFRVDRIEWIGESVSR